MNSAINIEAELRVDVDFQNLNDITFEFYADNEHLAKVKKEVVGSQIDETIRKWSGSITVDVKLLGFTKIYVRMIDDKNNHVEISKEFLPLIIIRKPRLIDHIFTGSVALLVSLLYINFGAAMDLKVLRKLIIKPVGPLIGFITQFALMPVLSYVLAVFVFPHSIEMQLGLFFTGISPSGGASNMWTVILGGNMNLSLLMTSLSNVAAFGMIPLWIFTLGQVIFRRGNMIIPYSKIATFAVALVIPLAIGVAIQKYSPKYSKILVLFLEPISKCLILFIIIFATVTNLYLFELFSWRIILAGSLLPWLGYGLAWYLARNLNQSAADALTIAIETGIQNTGIAIFLLRSLPQPQADLTTVIPVSVAIMTPFPLLGIYLYRKYWGQKNDIKYCSLNENDDERHIRSL
ncbi:P3 protein-like [Musca vetustissima]|uniref:P3 protein-like n=1 Tax=Musca vetustissima TaxID=27455 RepID=UPI002AB6A712|nr:P3 protein-like [Musca vetustissima]